MEQERGGSVGRRHLLRKATLTGVAALVPSVGGNAQNEQRVTSMVGELTPEEIIRLLDLQPNATCGFVRVTFVSKESIAPGTLAAPLAAARPLGSALYFMVTPGAPVRLHRIRNDQL